MSVRQNMEADRQRHEAERQKKKAEELAPYIEKAMARKTFMKELADDEIPNVVALGRQIVDKGDGVQQSIGSAMRNAKGAD